jgi:starch-binding outer membrane protein SusE/F
MRTIINFILLAAGVTVFLAACDKANDLPHYGNGKTPVLTASSTTIAPLPADSNNTALTLNWTFADYATDSTNIKYTIEIDSTGKNFAKATSKIVMGGLSTTFIAKELNNILLAKGYAFNVPVDMDVRVISSYANNNERLISNTIKIKMTPYKVPPKVALPASGKLFIVGGATQGGWNNPVPVPSQELARIDETTFGGIFQLTAGQSYLLLPVNGDWGAKYGGTGANNSNNPAGDNFKPEGGDLLAPATTGYYKVVFDFQMGKFTVTPYAGTLTTNLFIVGDATPGGWNNPVPDPAQKFTRVNSSLFELTLQLNAGKSYLFLPVNGDWGAKYGGMGANLSNNVLSDDFKYNGSDMLSPTVTGNYKISVNFATGVAAGSSGRITLVKL